MEHDWEALYLARNACIGKMEEPQPTQGYCNITWDGMLCWEATAVGTTARHKCPPYAKDVAKSGFATRECGDDGFWVGNIEVNATDGWTNYTDCFKPDPDFKAISNDLSRIELMTKIGYGISLVSLIIAVLIMLISRRLHCKSNSLHINLFIAFILRASTSFTKDILFVGGLGLEKDLMVDKDGDIKFDYSKQHWECKLLVSVFMYTVAASLMWIFMEGLYLYMLVYRTLFTERTGVRMYVLIGWLSPLIYIVPWLFARAYLDNTLCWNGDDDGYHWIIKGPIIVTIFVNFLFFINIVRVLCVRMKSHRNVKGSNQQIRKLAKFSLVLIPLFGVLYIGFAAYPRGLNLYSDVIYLYCEMFYNSFQGLLLAILFCFLNEEVHKEIKRCWYHHRRHDSIFMRSFTQSSHMSMATNTNRIRDTRNKVAFNKCKDNNGNPLQHNNRFTAEDKSSKTGDIYHPQTARFTTPEERDQVYPLLD